ncbi:hypothetical protein [Polycladidibacter stylochi]|uniref:hypothetical protein n=1 Tax=Polycladidibacter stylochi TaxID=1807766 RepID=UPI00082D509F|nr:hypothetical protein [Pseudovibrio stylochi]
MRFVPHPLDKKTIIALLGDNPILALWGCVAFGFLFITISSFFIGEHAQSPAQRDEPLRIVSLPESGPINVTNSTLTQKNRLSHNGTANTLNREVEALRYALVRLRLDIEALQQQNKALLQKVGQLTTGNLKSLENTQASSSTSQYEDGTYSTGNGGEQNTVSFNEAQLQQNKADYTNPYFPVKAAGDLQLSSVKLKRTRFALNLGHFRYQSDLENYWYELKKQYPALFSQLHFYPKQILQGKAESELMLVAGPLDNAADAAILCAHMAQRQKYCTATSY